MQTHWQRFSMAYLIGAFFFLVTVAQAINGEFANLTPEQAKSMTNFQWFLSWVRVLGAAGTTILAFLNKTAANVPPKGTAEPSPTPIPTSR